MKKITLLFLLWSVSIFAQPGTIDTTFSTGAGPDNAVVTSLTQPDGKILIGGAFTTYDGVSRAGIARLNSDGSLDTSFDPGSGVGVGEEVYSIALQSDGKIIIGGYFSTYNGVARNYIARLNTDGSLDTSFTADAGDYIMAVAVQSDDKILAGGFFTTFNSVAQNRFVRLNSDGSTDNTFNVGTGTNEYVYTMSVLPDDKIYLGGGFTSYNGSACSHLTRLNADGTPDLTFVQGTLGNQSVLTHSVQADGKVIIAGYFTNYDGLGRNGIARILADGHIDPTFNPGTGINFSGGRYPLAVLAQPNGKIVVGGNLHQYNGSSIGNIVRLNENGSVDTSFISGTGFNSIVYGLRFESDGKIIVSHGGTSYNGNTDYPFLTRINGYENNAISIAEIAPGPYCPNSSFDVDFDAEGYYAIGNIFTAQLSDQTGSFASPTDIGSVGATTSGTVSVTIPGNQTAGTGYRIRVISSDLATTGSDNGVDLAISEPTVYYADVDGDGYGDINVTNEACGDAPEGFVADSTDCDDADANVNPGADEIPGNGIDDDCDGEIDEGFYSQVQPSQCGSTLLNIGGIIGAVSVPGATGYRFEVTNTTTNDVQTIDRGVPNFKLNQLAQYDYSTTYSIRVEVQMNNVWVGYYGIACNVSTPDVIAVGGGAQITAAQCGQTLPTISTLIATTSLPNVVAYRFRVTDLSDVDGPNQVQTIDRGLHWFSLPMLTRYNYGTTYQIEVAVKTTVSGSFTAYGAPCTVTTPAVPSLNSCNLEIPSNNTLITTASLQNVTFYRFEVTNMTTLQMDLIDRPINSFRLNMVPGLTPSTDYNVRVALMTSGEYSPFGSACQITSPAAAREEIKAGTPAFNAVAYPNPFSSTFEIDLSGAVGEVGLKVYDMTGRLVDGKSINAESVQTVQLGESYPAGVYQVVLTHDGQSQTLRMIKR